MCGGGGGGNYYPPKDNTLELERMRQEEAERNRIREDEKATADFIARQKAFDVNIERGAQSARERFSSAFKQRGLEPLDYKEPIESAIKNQWDLIPYMDPQPGQYFSNDFINDVLMNEQNAKRSAYIRDVDKVYSPGFENNLISDTVDDPYIMDVLNTQRTAAQQQIDRAKARGNLDDTGYAGALSRLDELFKAGTATGQKLGGSVLQGYKEKLRSIGDTARADAGRYELGGTFDPNVYHTQRDNTFKDITTNLEGDLRGALSGTNFFDIGDIITQGGISQGATNPRLEQPAILAQRKEKQDAQRGLGGQGTF